MRAWWVLAAFALLYVLVGIALSPAHGLIGPLDEWIWNGLTFVTFTVLTLLDYAASPLARVLGVPDPPAVIVMLLVIGLVLAAFALGRLSRKEAGGRAGFTLLLMLAVSVPAGAILTLYQFSRLGH